MINNKELELQYQVLSDNIRFYRKKAHLTQERLAEKCDLSISYIKQIESNREYKNISLITMFKLSKALDASIEMLFKKD